MKAALLRDFGPPENFELVEIATPDPGAEEVLIRVEYIGLRWADVMARRNDRGEATQRPPWVPGREVLGTVERPGDQVTKWKRGDRVLAKPAKGGLAEFCVADANTLTHVPAGVSATQLLVYQGNMPVAYFLTHVWGRIQPGESVLVHAAAGGVGQLVLQILKRRIGQCTVIALSRSDAKLELCRALGAEHCVNTAKNDYATAVQKITGGRGVDIALNSVGGPTIDIDPTVIRKLGRWVIYGGAHSRPKIDLYKYIYSSFDVYPKSIVPYFGTDLYQEAVRFTHEWIRTEALDEATVYPLDKIVQAHRDLEFGASIGKIIVSPARC